MREEYCSFKQIFIIKVYGYLFLKDEFIGKHYI